jgi:hypothetical protein
METDIMANEKTDLMTAGKIAETMKVPGAKIKKAIESLGIKPQAKKGACSYYSKDIIPKLKQALK